MTRPLAPLSLPAMTMTVSPFLTFTPTSPSGRRMVRAARRSFAGRTVRSAREARACCASRFARSARSRSQHLRGEADDFHEPLVPQLAPDRAEDTGATRVATVLDDHGGVLVEADVRPVRPPLLLRGTHHDGLDHVALLHTGARDRVLDRGDDDVADARVAPTRAAEHPDAQNLPGTRVVGDAQSRLLLDHVNLLVVCQSSGCAGAWKNLPRLRAISNSRSRFARAVFWLRQTTARPSAFAGLSVTSPSRGSPRPASALSPTVAGSPSATPGRRCRTSSARRAPSACWCAAGPCRRADA